MNRTVFSLPGHSEYRTRGGLAVTRSVEQFTGGANRLDDLIDLLDRRRGVVLSSGTTVPGTLRQFRPRLFRSAAAAGNERIRFFASSAEPTRRSA